MFRTSFCKKLVLFPQDLFVTIVVIGTLVTSVVGQLSEKTVNKPLPVSSSMSLERRGFGFPQTTSGNLHHLHDHNVLTPPYNLIPQLLPHHNFVHHKLSLTTQERLLPSYPVQHFPHNHKEFLLKKQQEDLLLRQMQEEMNGGYGPLNPHVHSQMTATTFDQRRQESSTPENKRVFAGAILDNLSPSLINRSKDIIMTRQHNQDNQQRDQHDFYTNHAPVLTNTSSLVFVVKNHTNSLSNNNGLLANMRQEEKKDKTQIREASSTTTHILRANSSNNAVLHQREKQSQDWISFDPEKEEKSAASTPKQIRKESAAGNDQQKHLLWSSLLSSSQEDHLQRLSLKDPSKSSTPHFFSSKVKPDNKGEIIRGKKFLENKNNQIEEEKSSKESVEGSSVKESLCSASCKTRRVLVVCVVGSVVVTLLSLTSLVLILRFRRKWKELILHHHEEGEEDPPSFFLNGIRMTSHGQERRTSFQDFFPCRPRTLHDTNDISCSCCCSSSSSFPHQLPNSFSSIRFNARNNNNRNNIVNYQQHQSHSQRSYDHHPRDHHDWFHSRRERI